MHGSRFLIGDFVNALISFLVISAVIYFFVVAPMNKLIDRFRGQEPIRPKTRECPECLSKIPQAARRCAFCTAEVGTMEHPEVVSRPPAR